MSDTDPEVLFEELADEPSEIEAEAGHEEIPSELLELHVDLERAGMSPEDFHDLFGEAE